MKYPLAINGEWFFLTSNQRKMNWNENISFITLVKSYTNEIVNASKWARHSHRVDRSINWQAAWKGTRYFPRTSILHQAYKGLGDLAPISLLILHLFLPCAVTYWYSLSSFMLSIPQQSFPVPCPFSYFPVSPSFNTSYSLFPLFGQPLLVLWLLA